MSSETLQKSYDDVPYPELSYPQTHPNRLATLAIIMGLRPAPVTNCRVLELGCARGTNIIPMAYGLPDSEFVGIDFSANQIKSGQVAVANSGLQNVQLMQADITSLTADIGVFDYIIAHGFYSWTPEEAREQLMVICKKNLAKNGVAYISYNAYPGWHMQGVIRDMMIYHTRATKQPRLRIEQSRQLVSFLIEAIDVNDPYGVFLKAYNDMLYTYNEFDNRKRKMIHEGDNLLLHDELAEVNGVFYFHEFISHANRHGLQYLIEAEFPRSIFNNLTPKAEKALLEMSDDLIALEQYMDFLRNTSFRQTLLCHDDIVVERLLKPDSYWLSTLHAASHAKPVTTEINIKDNSVIEFRSVDGAVSNTDHPVSKSALLYLSRISPRSVPLTTLLEMAVKSVYGKELASLDKAVIDHDTKTLMGSLIKSFSCSMRLVELRAHEPRFVPAAGERPIACKFARWQVQHGHTKVTSLRHEMVELPQLSVFLLPHLNGENDRESIMSMLLELVQNGDMELKKEGEKVIEEKDVRKIMEQELEKNLQWLGRVALLEA